MLRYKGKYWAVMMPLIRRSMIQRCGAAFAETVAARAKPIYREMLREVDDVGADNPMAKNIYECFVFLAVWKAAEGRITPDDLRGITADVMAFPALRVMGLLMNANTPGGLRRFADKKRAACKWLEAHPQYKAVSWDFHFDNTLHSDGLYYHFTRCPLNAYARAHGMLEILPVMCDIDYMTAGLIHARLKRDYTLATGGALCDYWFCGDRLTEAK